MTHKILDHDTQKIIYRCTVRPKKSSTPNHRLAPHGGRFLHLQFPLDHHLDPQKVPHRNRKPLQSSSGPEMKRIHLDPSLCLPFTPSDLIGRTFLLPPEENGERHGAKVRQHTGVLRLCHMQWD